MSNTVLMAMAITAAAAAGASWLTIAIRRRIPRHIRIETKNGVDVHVKLRSELGDAELWTEISKALENSGICATPRQVIFAARDIHTRQMTKYVYTLQPGALAAAKKAESHKITLHHAEGPFFKGVRTFQSNASRHRAFPDRRMQAIKPHGKKTLPPRPIKHTSAMGPIDGVL